MFASPYPCQVTMKKFFVGGLLKGMTTGDKMGFINWEDACDWAGKATMNPKCDFVVLEMTNVKTGEVANF